MACPDRPSSDLPPGHDVRAPGKGEGTSRSLKRSSIGSALLAPASSRKAACICLDLSRDTHPDTSMAQAKSSAVLSSCQWWSAGGLARLRLPTASSGSAYQAVLVDATVPGELVVLDRVR